MILLQNCYAIATLDNEKMLYSQDILIEENRIKKIGTHLLDNLKAEERARLQILDCSDSIVIPGLVNTHHHFYQTLTRNVKEVQNSKLFDWLTFLYEIWKKIDDEAIYYSSAIAIGELLKTGCTLTTDHHYLYPGSFSVENKSIAKIQYDVAEKLGIRFAATRGSMSKSKKDGGLPPDDVVQSDDKILEDTEKVIKLFNDPSEDSMRRVIVAPCSPFSVSKELMKESVKLARKYGVKLHTHLAETSDEVQYCLKTYGKRPLALMEEVEFIGEDTFYAHGIYFDDNELDLLAKTKTGIAHCPSSNMRLGSGICRVVECHEKGIPIGIAVDGSASNDTSDMLGELRQTLLLQRVKYGSCSIDANTVFEFGTTGGASLLGFKNVGKIKENWLADLAVFPILRLDFTGSLSDPLAALLFCGDSHITKYTIVNGILAVKDGKLTGMEEETIIKKGNDISKKLLS